MRPPIPTRITIELLPPFDAAAGSWVARTSVDATSGGSTVSARLADARVDPGAPAEYEADPCTCHDGWCHRDHDAD